MTNLASMIEEKRSEMRDQARAISTRAAAEKRDKTPAEQREFDEIIENLKTQSSALDRVAEKRAEDRQSETALRQLSEQPINPAVYSGKKSVDPELNERFRDAIASRDFAPIDVLPNASEIRSGYSPGVEMRTMTQAGRVGTTFYDRILRHLTNNSAILAAGATLINSDSGEPLLIPRSTANSTATIVPEGSTIGSSDPTLSTASLGAWKYGALIQVTTELANDANFDLAGFLAAQAGTALANGAGGDFITGNGTGRPFGILGSSSTGVTGGTGVAGAFTADNLIDLYHSLAEPYARADAAGWLMNNTTLGAVRKLKDSQNRYLFSTDAPVSGASGTLLGRPVYADAAMPAIALSAKSVLFGDMSRYWVRSVNGVRFERSIDFGFANDLVTYRALWRTDGVLVDTSGAVKGFVGGAT